MLLAYFSNIVETTMYKVKAIAVNKMDFNKCLFRHQKCVTWGNLNKKYSTLYLLVWFQKNLNFKPLPNCQQMVSILSSNVGNTRSRDHLVYQLHIKYSCYSLTNIAVRKSKFWKNCVIKISMATIPFWSIPSTSCRISNSHSKWRWLPVTQIKYTYNKRGLVSAENIYGQ